MKRSVATVIAVLGLAGPARAGVELGGTAGLRVFSEQDGLGVKDGPDADSQRNTALFGLRLGVYFNKMLGVEAEAGVIPGEGRSMLYDVWNVTYRASLVAQFLAEGDNPIVPFALIGGGLHTIVSSTNEDAIGKGTSPVPHLGGGIKYRAGNGFGVRFDARLLLPPSSQSSSVTADFELLASIYRDFSFKKKPVVTPKKEEPPKDEDPDKDGIVGAADQCPTEAEDKDGFQDEDGCPDLDNDGDGVADSADQCPMEAEDKDGFQDEDGCPDLDNDNDGVPDSADKCALEPETRNGYLDEDGCADELPEKLRTLLATPQAVAWKPSTADFAPGATKLLDAVVDVLTEVKEVKLEIGAHTEDVAPPKASKLADNAALSQARADAVKAYLISKGIDEARLTTKGYGDSVPLEDPKGLTGPKLTAARAKNRRIELKLIVAAPAATTPPPAAPTSAPAPAA
ncbi:MAG TPA: OmpA family protein, partial [Kofleriaceae bacterium]|nr:OmpA family protein [Kofleriaceae bacterium]